MTPSLLAATDIHHAYGTASVLRGISLTIGAGEIVYLLGRNGSGKTTLLHILSGVLKPSRGQVLLGADDLHRLSATQRTRRIGLIPQLHSTTFAYTARQIVTMGRAPHLPLLGTPGRTDAVIVEDALQQVGLAKRADTPYTELSGGQRQLVLVARGIAQQCRLLLMDEPDAHLDPNNQQRVMEIVTRLAGAGLSFIVVSHSPNNALVYAHRVLLLLDGRLLAEGVPALTLTEPLLTEAYDLPTEVLYQRVGEQDIARAVLPRRP